MREVAVILTWWLLFGGTHVLGSNLPVRGFLAGKLGLLGFKAVYSLVAVATFVPLCWVYFTHKHAGPALWTAWGANRWIAQVLMLLALITLVQSLVTPSPLTTLAEVTGKFRDRARGIQRITRHPQNCSFALFGLAHLLCNPFAGDLVFFGGFVVYGLISAVHQDRRTLAGGRPEVSQYQDDTSLIPFAAILAGRQHWAVAEYNRIGLLLSAFLFVMLRLFHARLFGGFGA